MLPLKSQPRSSVGPKRAATQSHPHVCSAANLMALRRLTAASQLQAKAAASRRHRHQRQHASNNVQLCRAPQRAPNDSARPCCRDTHEVSLLPVDSVSEAISNEGSSEASKNSHSDHLSSTHVCNICVCRVCSHIVLCVCTCSVRLLYASAVRGILSLLDVCIISVQYLSTVA